MEEKNIVAIDLGTSKIALTVAKVNGDDVQVVYYKETPSAGIINSEVSNMGHACAPLSHLIKDAEDALCIKLNHVVIGMPKFPIRQEANSGKVTARIDSADEVRISGQNDEDVPEQMREFFLRANGTVQNLGVSSSYAKVDVAASSVRSGEVGSVFADLCFSAEKVGELTLQNSRNGIYATVLSFNDLEIENFEGECELTLSPDASFVLTVKEKDRFKHPTVPTSVTVGFADAAHSGAQYTVGSGENAISVATAGAFSVLPLAQAD